VNVSGCLVIGFFATYTGTEGRLLVRPEWRLAFTAGVCGDYTTFSSFSLQTLSLTMEGDWFRAAANVLLSVVLCLGAVWAGHLCAAALSR
jgi:CrcB protein